MIYSWEEGLQHVLSLTNSNFAEYVKTTLNGHQVQSLVLDVCDHQGTYKVDSYLKDSNGDRHIFSYWRRNGHEEMGSTTLSSFEVDMLISL